MSYKSAELITRLRDARQAAGMSQRALSARSGLTQSHISQIERGMIEPGLSSLIEMARALDLELALIPKKLLPAIQGILPDPRIEHALSPEGSKAALDEIVRGERLLAKRKLLYGSSAALDRITHTLQFLRRAPIQPNDLAIVRDAIDTLHRIQGGPRWHEVVNDIAASLETLRNRLAHGRAASPRPAYGPDVESDDA